MNGVDFISDIIKENDKNLHELITLFLESMLHTITVTHIQFRQMLLKEFPNYTSVTKKTFTLLPV